MPLVAYSCTCCSPTHQPRPCAPRSERPRRRVTLSRRRPALKEEQEEEEEEEEEALISAAAPTMRGGPRPLQRAESQDARDAPRRSASFGSMKLSA